MKRNNHLPLFSPSRLTQAREIRGFSMSDIAERVGVSQQSISQYEAGKKHPGADVLERLSNSLNVPMHFFLKTEVAMQDHPAFFRSTAKARKKVKNVHAHKLRWIHDIAAYLNTYLMFPNVDIPQYGNGTQFVETQPDRIEAIATEVRRHWGLGDGPISNLVLLFEKKGVISARSPFSSYNIDACSQWIEDRPYILFSNDKTAVRSRFDAAHELGHLVLHSRLTQSEFNTPAIYKIIEKEANHFAGAFLLPERSFGREFHSTSLTPLVELKKRWRVSIGAMLYRAKQLNMITEHQYVYAIRTMNAQGMRYQEPLDDELPFEASVVLKQGVEALINNEVLSRDALVYGIGLNRDEIEAMAGLDDGYLIQDNQSSGIVLPFRRQVK
jgi:Zn-dependent peptidase ImmA (M78 family)/transcriptional regulator with XRE-family HTH domain